MRTIATTLGADADLPDEEVIRRVIAGDLDCFSVLMRRYNRRVFRTVRGILRSDAEAEDAAQDAWLDAFRALESFEGRSSFGTWLTRIAIHRALARIRGRGHASAFEDLDRVEPAIDDDEGPESAAQRRELARALEIAIDSLPPSYRLVIMLRDVEHMSTAEAAEALGVAEENLRVRLHRSRAALRDRLIEEMGAAAIDAFRFDGGRCDRLVAVVMEALQNRSS